MNKRIFYFICVAVLCAATLVPFCYKAIWKPVTLVANLQDSSIRRGDFWGAFPAYFVGKYNPELRNRTIVKNWSGEKYWDYGPLMHVITLPLTAIKSIKVVSIIWLMCNYLFLAGTFFLIIKILNKLPWVYKIIVLCMWMGYWPLYIAIQEDVIEIFEIFAIALSLYMLCKKRETPAGIAMGIAGMIKFLPLVFLPYFLIGKKFKAFAAMLVTVLVIGAATQLTLGWQNSWTFKLLSEEVKNKHHEYTYFRSQSITAIIERLFSETDYSYRSLLLPRLKNPRPVNSMTKFIILGISIFVFYSIYRKNEANKFGLEYGILTTLMILIPPHSQFYYLMFCLIGYSVAVYYIYKTRYLFGAAILAISYFIAGYIMQIWLFDSLLLSEYGVSRNLFFLFLSFPAYGAVLLLLLLLVIYNKADLSAGKNKAGLYV